MSLNPHIIPRRPRDPGAAHQFVDHNRRLKKLEGTYGVVGGAATVTGATIETADSGARIYMQGSEGAQPGGEGIFVVDANGNTAISLVPGQGMTLQSGSGTINVYGGGSVAIQIAPDQGITIESSNLVWSNIAWASGGWEDASIGVSRVVETGGYTGGDLTIRVAPLQSTSNIVLGIRNVVGPDANVYQFNNVGVFYDINGKGANLCDQHSNASWTGVVTAGSYSTVSDKAFKKDVMDLAEEASSRLHNLRVVSFRWKDELEDTVHYGIIAQEATDHIPELVHTANVYRGENRNRKDPLVIDGVPVVNQTSLLALAVAEIQVLQKRVAQLERTEDGKS